MVTLLVFYFLHFFADFLRLIFQFQHPLPYPGAGSFVAVFIKFLKILFQGFQ